MIRLCRRAATVAALALLLAACDKCGDPMRLNAPSLPKTCYGEPVGK